MADSGMVALREALGKILETEHADVFRDPPHPHRRE